jgi:hypothetical protein
MLIDIENSTREQLIQEYNECEKLWGKYSSDCFGFYMTALHKQISKLGGFLTYTPAGGGNE